MLLRICRKHMSRFLISSRSSLSHRNTVLPRADEHWFCEKSKAAESCDKRKRRRNQREKALVISIIQAESQTECKLQREKENISLPKTSRDEKCQVFSWEGGEKCSESKHKHICCRGSVLWDSNNHCRSEGNTFIVTLQHLRKYTVRSAQPPDR